MREHEARATNCEPAAAPAERAIEHCTKPLVVLGCGNVLRGDDGFGPAVAERLLAAGRIPPWAAVVNAGSSVRDLLFDMLVGEHRPRTLVLVDILEAGRRPGEVFALGLDELPVARIGDFSPHQAPTSTLLRQLRDARGVKVLVVACQATVGDEVGIGLTPGVDRAADQAAQFIAERFLTGRL
jgi:coenzyme F420 hydrogenase subunit delta